MSKGAWGTGTWDDAQWDSLPIFGNEATGGVGSPSVSVSQTLTGVSATGAAGINVDADFSELTSVVATASVGVVESVISIGLTGVQAQGLAGSETESVNILLNGVVAVGLAGVISESLTIGITGVSAAGSVGNVGTNSQPSLIGVAAIGLVGVITAVNPNPIIFVVDTHDGGKSKKERDAERERNKKRRDEIIASYERIVEGKIPQEIIEPYVETFIAIKTQQNISNDDINRLMQNLDTMQEIWNDHIESDDIEVLLL